MRKRLRNITISFAAKRPRELTIYEIEQLENCMVEAVCACYDLGYDGVELHTPHGYLLHQFLSGRSNQRTDLYGGSIENRGRVVTNIIERVRKKVGPDKVLGCRLSGDELMPEGLTHEEACAFVKLFTEAGANYFNVSQGGYENLGAGFAPDGEDEFTKWAPGFKDSFQRSTDYYPELYESGNCRSGYCVRKN